jgi:hypothetical protein
MKIFSGLIKYLSTLPVIVFAGLFISCGDSGVSTIQNSGTLSLSKLQPIDKNLTGTYELWGSVESAADHDENTYRSMGRFVVTASNQVTDTNGNAFSPYLGRISNINNVSDVLITIQPPGYFDTVPSNIKVLGGSKQLQGNELVYNLTMSYSDILPVSSQFAASSASYILASPTTGTASSEYRRGIWFTADTNGTAAGITLPVLSDTSEWTYQAWVVKDISGEKFYNIGRFDDPNASDNNQQCQQNPPLMQWLHPGHDWLQANCPGGFLPDITDLTQDYSVLITLEPRFEQGSELFSPFYIKILTGTIGSLPFGAVNMMSNEFANFVPSGQLKLKTN